jgi:hypothetical protein
MNSVILLLFQCVLPGMLVAILMAALGRLVKFNVLLSLLPIPPLCVLCGVANTYLINTFYCEGGTMESLSRADLAWQTAGFAVVTLIVSVPICIMVHRLFAQKLVGNGLCLALIPLCLLLVWGSLWTGLELHDYFSAN